MPRTPLMSMLLSIASEARRWSVGPRVDRGRRAILIGAAATASAAAFGKPLPGKRTDLPRVGIVGAGLAGLTAAYRLQQRGILSVLFEGDTRLGGRCFSDRISFEDGQVGEHGGEFIDTGHQQIRSLAKELGLPLDDVVAAQPAGAKSFYDFGGSRYTIAEATKDFQPLFSTIKSQNASVGDSYDYKHSSAAAKMFDNMTIAQWVDRYVVGGRTSKLGQLIENAFTEENAADSDEQSALNLLSGLSAVKPNEFDLYYQTSDQRSHVRGGADQIVARLAEKLAPSIQVGSALTAIVRLPDGRMKLTIARDTKPVDEIFDRVVLALPFSVMREKVEFVRAGFSPLKQRAIRELAMGASNKLQLQFNRRLWNELGCSGEIRLTAQDFQTSWDVTRAQPGQRGILNFWSGGKITLNAGVDKETLARRCLADAERLLPGLTAAWNGHAALDIWKSNPWSLGSYCYYRPGYQTTLFGVEAAREGNCFFAGEHTWSEAGFMNSAVASGERAAQEVLSSIRR
jgi:monoamine oxidase